MSKAAKPEAGEEKPKKGKKLLIIILLIVLILGAAAAAGVLFLLKSKHSDDEEEEPAAAKEQSHKAAPPPVYASLDPFTVNLVPEHGDQYMQVTLSLQLDNAESNKALAEHMPQVRNNLTLTLSSKKASELMTKEGKEQLAEELKNEINQILAPPSGKNKKKAAEEGPVISVLFTSFIIQ